MLSSDLHAEFNPQIGAMYRSLSYGTFCIEHVQYPTDDLSAIEIPFDPVKYFRVDEVEQYHVQWAIVRMLELLQLVPWRSVDIELSFFDISEEEIRTILKRVTFALHQIPIEGYSVIDEDRLPLSCHIAGVEFRGDRLLFMSFFNPVTTVPLPGPRFVVVSSGFFLIQLIYNLELQKIVHIKTGFIP